MGMFRCTLGPNATTTMQKVWKAIDKSDRLTLAVLGVCLAVLVALLLIH
jgi:hypothetical protein